MCVCVHMANRQEKQLKKLELTQNVMQVCLGMGILGLFLADCFKILDSYEQHNTAKIPIALYENYWRNRMHNTGSGNFSKTLLSTSSPHALVLVSHTHGAGYEFAQEWENLNYFLRHGVNTSMADYLFVMPVIDVVETTGGCWPKPYVNKSHVSFVCLHQSPPSCDLCIYAQMLHLQSLPPYSTLVVLNTGSRGPMRLDMLMHTGQWLREVHAYTSQGVAISMGGMCNRGQQHQMLLAAEHEWEFTISTVFLAVPAGVAQRLARVWAGTCLASSIEKCSSIGEFPLLEHIFLWGLRIYLTEQQLLLEDRGHARRMCSVLSPANQNPNVELRPIRNLSDSWFIKYGGGAYKKRFIPESTVKAVQHAAY